MSMLVFLVGALLGTLTGGMFCVRYLRREVAADIGPRLRHIQLQLDNLEAAVNPCPVHAIRGNGQPPARSKPPLTPLTRKQSREV